MFVFGTPILTCTESMIHSNPFPQEIPQKLKSQYRPILEPVSQNLTVFGFPFAHSFLLGKQLRKPSKLNLKIQISTLKPSIGSA